MGLQNDVPITMGIDVCQTQVNGGRDCDGGGGTNIKFTPQGTFQTDGTCSKVVCTTSAQDSSNKFVGRWYSSGSGQDQCFVSGVRFCQTES